MTDNRTTERLMAMLEERGVKHELEHDLYVEWVDARGNDVTAFETSCKHKGDVLIVHVFLTPEQAIAATLGSERDEIYNAGFDNGIKAVLHQLDGLLVKTDSAVEIQAWVDEQWKEYES